MGPRGMCCPWRQQQQGKAGQGPKAPAMGSEGCSLWANALLHTKAVVRANDAQGVCCAGRSGRERLVAPARAAGGAYARAAATNIWQQYWSPTRRTTAY